MAVSWRSELIRELVVLRYGSIDGLVVEWEERVRTRRQQGGRARNRGTIYRWLQEGFPTKKEDVLGFAALLDVDPVALLQIDDEFVRLHFGRERRLFQLGALSRSRLGVLWALYMPGASWPDSSIARSYYGRDWTRCEYIHPAEEIKNTFACFNLNPMKQDTSNAPWVAHFSYRRISARDGMWRPYGTVIRIGRNLQLISESGDTREITLSACPSQVPVETYFGPGAVEFRVASIHHFDMTVTVPSRNPQHLRFEA